MIKPHRIYFKSLASLILICSAIVLLSSSVLCEVNWSKVQKTVNLSHIPALEYDDATLSYTQQFVKHYNLDDYEGIFSKFSERVRKEVEAEQIKNTIIILKKMFGNINKLEELTSPAQSETLEKPNGQTLYFLSAIDDWKGCSDLGYKVRIYKASYKKW